MSKIILKIFLLNSLLSIGCTENVKKPQNENNSKKEASFQQEIQDYKKTIPATSKNPKHDIWNINVYRNSFYNFRVEFPKRWEYDNGTSKITLARALKRDKGAAFSVSVSHLPDKPANPNDITESYSSNSQFESYFNEALALQNTKAENFKIQKGKLNNFPAYLIEFTNVVSAGSRTYTYLSKQVQCYYDSKIYQVTLNLPVGEYDNEMNWIYDRVVSSFNFEIAY